MHIYNTACYRNVQLALMLFILTDKIPRPVLRLPVCPDPSFPLAHAVKRVCVCAYIEGSGTKLGLRLKLPLHVVDAIFSRHVESDKCLLHITNAFLKQVEPRPTWRVIVDALRTPAVNMPQLARRVEETYFPCHLLQRDIFPETGIILYLHLHNIRKIISSDY